MPYFGRGGAGGRAARRGRCRWNAVRLGPADDATEVTAAQVREVVAPIIEAGHWRDGDPDIVVIYDAGYDLTRLAWLLRDLPTGLVQAAQRPGDALPGAAPGRGPARDGRAAAPARGSP